MGVTRETNHNSGVHPPIYGNLSSSRYRAAAILVPNCAFPEPSRPRAPDA